MSFLEFMVSNMEYNGWSSFFGAMRGWLWEWVVMLSELVSAVEGLYDHVFSIIGVIYSKPVVTFIRNWLPYLWIPIAISIVVLGYSAIMNDADETKKRIKLFARNVCLFAIIIFGLPYIFIGHGYKSAVFTGGTDSLYPNTAGYTTYGYISGDENGNSGVIDFFAHDEGSGIVDAMKAMTGREEDVTHVGTVITSNLYDLKHIYEQVDTYGSGMSFDNKWTKTYLESGIIKKNSFQNVKGKGYLGINFMQWYDYDYVDEEIPTANRKVKDVMATGYDNLAPLSTTTVDKQMDMSVREYLFQYVHKSYLREYSDENTVSSVTIHTDSAANSEGKTQSGKIGGLFSEFPYRYKVDWLPMLIQLIATGIVLFLVSYKVVRIIYELTFNQFLAMFFGAADLSNGQRIKEILRSIIGLILSLLFAVILVEFYFVISEALSTIEFDTNGANNVVIRAIINVFLAMAAVKGPSVLEKILGIEGGLSGSWRDMGAFNRAFIKPVQRMATMGAYFASKKVDQARSEAKAEKREAHSRAERQQERAERQQERQREQAERQRERRDNQNQGHALGYNAAMNASRTGNHTSIGGIGDTQRAEIPGDAAQFGIARNERSANTFEQPLDAQERRMSNGVELANEEVAGQCRDIAAEMESTGDKYGMANEYGGNIQNAALAEMANGKNESEALEDAYRASGLDADDAHKFAERDLADGSFTQKQDDFDNSISQNARDRYNNNPEDYKNEYEAYQAAATEHYQALGFEGEEAGKMAESKASQVYVDDKQTAIRVEAQQNLNDSSKQTQSVIMGDTYTEANAWSEAATTVLERGGYTGNIDTAVSQIKKQGGLDEGIKTGRIARNSEAKRAVSNTRSELLSQGYNNDVIVGYNSGYNQYHDNARRRTTESYRRSLTRRAGKGRGSDNK